MANWKILNLPRHFTADVLSTWISKVVWVFEEEEEMVWVVGELVEGSVPGSLKNSESSGKTSDTVDNSQPISWWICPSGRSKKTVVRELEKTACVCACVRAWVCVCVWKGGRGGIRSLKSTPNTLTGTYKNSSKKVFGHFNVSKRNH